MTQDPPQKPDPAGSLVSAIAAVSLRERRTKVVALLSHAFARDELDVDELDRRMEVAHRAITVSELDALVADVAGGEPTTALARRETKDVVVRSLTTPSSGLQVGGMLDRPERQALWAVMGGVQRAGRWMVPRHTTLHCLAGGISLDFREADLAPGVTELTIICLMGGVEIIVPPNLNVEVAGSAILGGFDQEHPGADGLTTEPVATLRITGVAFAGGVGVETRRIGESSRQARKRIKSERKMLLDAPRPSAGQAALPSAVALPERKSKR